MARTYRAAWTMLATRVPKDLRLRLKLHCINAEMPVMDFVVAAIGEKLARSRGIPARQRATKG
jgi:hypothetical protein